MPAQLLIDRGKLALDDPVAKYLPGFDTDAARALTLDVPSQMAFALAPAAEPERWRTR